MQFIGHRICIIESKGKTSIPAFAVAVAALAAVAQSAVELHPAQTRLELPDLALAAAMGAFAAAVAGGALFPPLAVA